MDASISDLTSGITEIFQSKSSAKEIVTASQQGVVTSAGYSVQSSVSHYNGKFEVVTAQGYKFRTTVQSTIFKE